MTDGSGGIELCGRRWPPAGWLERLVVSGMVLCCLGVLATALYLNPDARGYGTHEQLGLPPCGFTQIWPETPCPSCGFTTTFTLAAHGRPVAAFTNQPFGFLVFLLTCGFVPLAGLAVWHGISVARVCDPWPWRPIIAVTASLWLLAWAYKWWQVAA